MFTYILTLTFEVYQGVVANYIKFLWIFIGFYVEIVCFLWKYVFVCILTNCSYIFQNIYFDYLWFQKVLCFIFNSFCHIYLYYLYFALSYFLTYLLYLMTMWFFSSHAMYLSFDRLNYLFVFILSFNNQKYLTYYPIDNRFLHKRVACFICVCHF